MVLSKRYGEIPRGKFLLTPMPEAVIYRNQPTDLLSKSIDRFLHSNGLRHERVNGILF